MRLVGIKLKSATKRVAYGRNSATYGCTLFFRNGAVRPTENSNQFWGPSVLRAVFAQAEEKGLTPEDIAKKLAIAI